MRKYLSRIARQTGLHFSGQGAVYPRVSGEPSAETPPARLDREETVMVSFSAETKSAEPATLKPGSTPEQPAANPCAPKPDPSATLTPANPRSTETVVSKKTATGGQAPLSNPSKNQPTENVNTVFVKPPAIAEQQEKERKDPGRNARPIPKEPEKRLEVHHFSKTAEIIAGRHAEPVETQNILLREIQEWVAAGNTSDAEAREEANPSVASVASGVGTRETQPALSVSEPEPGVVRIGEKHHREPIAKEASRIEQQSFDLSIGTISVVIEGDEHPPQPAPAPRAGNQSNRPDAGRARSRLSRNYL